MSTAITFEATASPLFQPFVDIALDSWRFSRMFGKLLAKLDESEAARYANQYRFFVTRLHESLLSAGFRIVDLEGHPYDTGMAVSALNIGDFGPDDSLVIDQMVEPVLMGASGLVRAGTVMLKLAGTS